MNELFSNLGLYLSRSFVQNALIVGVLIALCSSLLGVTLVLKRYSFIGDGLSHVAFGAMAVAAVMGLTNDMPLVLTVTVVCAVLLLRMGKNAKIKGDAAIAMISVGALAIGYLPQQTDVQRDFPASVREIVLSGCLGHDGFRPFYNKADKALAARSMERMNITDLSRRCYRELSGGQQQRVLLARALCATEKILLLDEPVAGLDPKVTAELYELIESLKQADGVTVIMISHDVDKALQYASHILHIGSDIFFGTKDEFLNAKKEER